MDGRRAAARKTRRRPKRRLDARESRRSLSISISRHGELEKWRKRRAGAGRQAIVCLPPPQSSAPPLRSRTRAAHEKKKSKVAARLTLTWGLASADRRRSSQARQLHQLQSSLHKQGTGKPGENPPAGRQVSFSPSTRWAANVRNSSPSLGQTYRRSRAGRKTATCPVVTAGCPLSLISRLDRKLGRLQHCFWCDASSHLARAPGNWCKLPCERTVAGLAGSHGPQRGQRDASLCE
jgi:hypothetical protein